MVQHDYRHPSLRPTHYPSVRPTYYPSMSSTTFGDFYVPVSMPSSSPSANMFVYSPNEEFLPLILYLGCSFACLYLLRHGSSVVMSNISFSLSKFKTNSSGLATILDSFDFLVVVCWIVVKWGVMVPILGISLITELAASASCLVVGFALLWVRMPVITALEFIVLSCWILASGPWELVVALIFIILLLIKRWAKYFETRGRCKMVKHIHHRICPSCSSSKSKDSEFMIHSASDSELESILHFLAVTADMDTTVVVELHGDIHDNFYNSYRDSKWLISASYSLLVFNPSRNVEAYGWYFALDINSRHNYLEKILRKEALYTAFLNATMTVGLFLDELLTESDSWMLDYYDGNGQLVRGGQVILGHSRFYHLKQQRSQHNFSCDLCSRPISQQERTSIRGRNFDAVIRDCYFSLSQTVS